MDRSNKRTPLVSILSLCYNQEPYCVATLNSIYEQSYKNIELILIDDYSSDNSVKVISEWQNNHSDLRMKFIEHNENMGICKSFNEALSHARGDYIELIACDDIMLKDKTLHQLDLLEKSANDVACVYSDAYIIDRDSNVQKNTFKELRGIEEFKSGKIFEPLLRLNFIHILTAMFKREVFNKVGHFDEELSFEDYDFILRVAREYRILFSNYISTQYRFHYQNTSLQLTKSHAPSYFQLLKKYHGDSDSIDNILKYRLLEVALACMASSHVRGVPLFREYIQLYSPSLIFKIIVLNKYLFKVIFALPFRYRKSLMSFRNRIWKLSHIYVLISLVREVF